MCSLGLALWKFMRRCIALCGRWFDLVNNKYFTYLSRLPAAELLLLLWQTFASYETNKEWTKGSTKSFYKSQYYSINWWLELYEHSLLIQQKNMENLFYFSVTASHIAFLSSSQIEKYDCPSKEIPDNFFHWPTPHCSIVY